MKKQVLTLGAAAMLAALAYGQKDTLAPSLDDVTITANRFVQKQSQTGKVVSVITKLQLEQSAGKTLGQLLNEQAGIVINGANGNLGTNQTVYVRGAGSGRALILLDGMPVYDPSLINSEFDLNFISLFDIERIEICRGAQSTMYGSDAIAGVINIITTKGNVKKPFNVKALQSFGNYGNYRTNVQLYGKANKLQYQTRFTNISSKGFSSATDTVGNKNFDNDKYQGTVTAANLKYDFTKSFTVKAFGQYTNYKNDADGGAFVDDRDFTLSNKNVFSGINFQYKKDKFSLQANYQYSQTKRGYVNDSGFVSGFSKYENSNYKGQSNFAELFGNFELGKHFTLVSGVDYRSANMTSDYLSISSFGPYTSQFPKTSVEQWSTYASLIFSGEKKKLNVELGMRYNQHSAYGNKITYTFNPSYSITDQLRVFGSIATGFKAPSLYQLYAGPSIGNPNLNAETSTNYELGFQYSNKQFSGRAVYYYRNTDNGIDYLGFPANPSGYFNYINQVGNGVEVELSYKLDNKFTVSGNFSLLDANEKTQSRLNAKDTSYTYLLRRPKVQFNINAGYAFTPELFVSTGIRYAGKRYDVGGYRKADKKLEDYTVVNLYGEYKLLKALKLFVDMQNLFNVKFYDAVGFNAIPFMFSTGVTFNL